MLETSGLDSEFRESSVILSDSKEDNTFDAHQQPPRKVPSLSTSSRWDQPEFGHSSLDSSMPYELRIQSTLNGSEAVPDIFEQSMDMNNLDAGLEAELDDSREGSPCRRAATELLVPGSFGEDVRADERLLSGPRCSPPGDSYLSCAIELPRHHMHIDMAQEWTDPCQQQPQHQQQHPDTYNGPGFWNPNRQRQAWFQHPAFSCQQPYQPIAADPSCMIPHQNLGSAQPYIYQRQQAQAPLYQREDQMVPGNLGGRATPPVEGDWLTCIMDQALSVGLWGGSPSPEVMEQGNEQPPSGSPTPTNAFLSRSPSGMQSRCLGEVSPSGDSSQDNIRSFYQSEMEAMLPLQSNSRNGVDNVLRGVGQISRELQLPLHPSQPQPQQDAMREMPRLQPVSMGMTNNSLADMLACSEIRGMNDGPYRPPTKPPPRKLKKLASTSGLSAPHSSMLHQSRLQLSLGLDAETPIDLRSWGYGEESNTGQGQGDDSGCVSSGFRDEGYVATEGTKDAHPCSVDVDVTMPLPSSSISLPAIKVKVKISPSAASSMRNSTTAEMPGLASGRNHWENGSTTDGEGRGRLAEGKPHRAAPEEVAATRADCLERYRDKKRRRLVHKTIRYHKRKVNADKRPRIKGRFVKSMDDKAEYVVDNDKMKSKMRSEVQVVSNQAGDANAVHGQPIS